ncbi:50S ribosomal protein L9 [Pseudomonas aeruginosa]|nr:50S ribosomal protein L9 [Pseudomonas aeruginosa]
MEVILLEKVANLGNLGDKVNIKGGYARNFLLPQGKATVATAENVAAFEARRAELEKAAAEKKAAAEARAAQLSELVVTLGAHAGDEAVSAAGYPLEKAEVRLPNGALRNTGEFDVAVHLHTDVETTLKLIIVAE